LGYGFVGAESWTLRKVNQKYVQSFEVWGWRRIEKINWADRMRNKKGREEYHTYNEKKEGCRPYFA